MGLDCASDRASLRATTHTDHATLPFAGPDSMGRTTGRRQKDGTVLALDCAEAVNRPRCWVRANGRLIYATRCPAAGRRSSASQESDHDLVSDIIRRLTERRA